SSSGSSASGAGASAGRSRATRSIHEANELSRKRTRSLGEKTSSPARLNRCLSLHGRAERREGGLALIDHGVRALAVGEEQDAELLSGVALPLVRLRMVVH